MNIFHKNYSQQGLTLVEMMIAITIGLVVVLAVGSIYIGSRGAYKANDAASEINSNGRYAIQLLSQAIRGAGYAGCMGNMTKMRNTLVQDGYVYSYDNAVNGSNNTGAGTWSPALDGSITAQAPLIDADTITIRAAQSTGASITTPFMPTTAAALHIATGNGLKAGDVVIVSDCNSSAALQISAGTPDTSGTLVHGTGAGSPGNSTADLGKIYKSDAQVFSLDTTSFFLKNNTANPAQPSLYRLVNYPSSPPEELVEGIEDMQIQYNNDPGNNNVIVQQDSADLAADKNIKAVRICVLARSTADNVTTKKQTYIDCKGAAVVAPDFRLRRAFSALVTIRNRVN